MNNTTYYQRHREITLNKTKDYYENDKEGLRAHARDEFKNLSEEGKNKKKEYCKKSRDKVKEKHDNLPEEKKREIKELQKNRRDNI